MKRNLFITSVLVINSLSMGNLNVNSNIVSYLEKRQDDIVNSFGFKEVTVTMYNPVESQTDDTPYLTADLSRINKVNPSAHKWIAISYDLHKRYGGQLAFGDTVYLYGSANKDGFYTVRDLMNPRYTNRIDILESIGSRMYKFDNCLLIYSNDFVKKDFILNNTEIVENYVR